MLQLKLKNERKRVVANQTELDNDWRNIPGFPHYQINRAGQVKRLDAIIKDSNGMEFYRRGRILSTRKTRLGYVQVDMCENGKPHGTFIHVLLAKVFIPNPNNLPIVNHIDENPSNNDLSNLEWCDYSYNANYSINKIRKSHEKEQIAVIRINLLTKEETRYFGIREAARLNNCSHSNITSAIKRNGTCASYKWKYG